MKRRGIKDISDSNYQSRSDLINGRKKRAHATLKKNLSRRESAVIDNEAAVLSREILVAAREKVADLRDDVARLRDTEAQVMPADRINMLRQANEKLVVATIESRNLADQVQIANDHLDHLAHHDALTDLPNRILLQDRLSQAIELAHRQGKQLAVMFMDLDQFKHINDSLGHTVGDQLLQSVAQRLLDCVRQSDTISRQGGDEFVLLLPFIKHSGDVALSAQKMLAALAGPHHIDLHELHINASIGISIYPDDGQDAETLLKNADAAMYHAKENGRNHYEFFKTEMNARAVQRQATEASLRDALERQEFVLHYQPKINFHNGTIVGVEALIRWQHPERGLLLPAQFVPVAEDCGLILPIGRWVLRTTCLQARAWLQMGLPPITVAVNISALELLDKSFLDNICATLEVTGIEPHYLQIELTESVLMQDAESANSVLHALADMGVKIAIDDFGSGYSCLANLKQFPIDTLKIDQSFVSDVISNPDNAIIVSTVISIGKSFNQHIIAEGVETPEQYAFLLAQHCDEGQGYYFSRPLESVAFARLLKTGVPPCFAH
jgi:diguanylate cyclase (GGDEF)-like protein